MPRTAERPIAGYSKTTPRYGVTGAAPWDLEKADVETTEQEAA